MIDLEGCRFAIIEFANSVVIVVTHALLRVFNARLGTQRFSTGTIDYCDKLTNLSLSHANCEIKSQ